MPPTGPNSLKNSGLRAHFSVNFWARGQPKSAQKRPLGGPKTVTPRARKKCGQSLSRDLIVDTRRYD